jgi:hypothetical protein
MKYKIQALNKIEKIEHTIKAIEHGVHRGLTLEEIQANIERIKELVEDLKSNVTIENDEWAGI